METLKLKRPIGKTIILTLLVLLMLLFATELILRLGPIQSRLPNSNFGGRHELLETQFARLDKLTVGGEKIDCIFLGNSLIWFGVDPEKFQIAYEDASGSTLHCFNFGVSAMPSAAAADLADYLVETYDPELFIYGAHARDLAVPITDEDSQIVVENPWFKYRRGETSLLSRLKARSLIYRNLDYLQILIRLDMFTARNPLGWQYRQLHGFDGKGFALLDVEELPDREDPAQQEGFSWYWDYQILDENLEAVNHIAQLNNTDRQVIIMVMPVHPNFKYFFQNGDEDYARFLAALEGEMDQSSTPFWVLDGEVAIPATGWFDYSHLNVEGAEFFSQWFGQKVGEYILSKR